MCLIWRSWTPVGLSLHNCVDYVVAVVQVGTERPQRPWTRHEEQRRTHIQFRTTSGRSLACDLCGNSVQKPRTVDELQLSAFSLQLVAVFDEVYGFLHFAISVLFLASLAPTSILYFVERRSSLALASLTIGLVSWILYWMKIYSAGVAVPETISSVAATAWIIHSALKIYKDKQDNL